MQNVRFFVSYANKAESDNIINYFPFLVKNDTESRREFCEVVESVYEGVNIDFITNVKQNEITSKFMSVRFHNIVRFEEKHLTDQAINALGGKYRGSWDWRYLYGIAIHNETRKPFLVAFSNACSPNWNEQYNTEHLIPLEEVDFPILKEDGVIYKIEDNFHAEINNRIFEGTPLYTEKDGMLEMWIADQHGNRKKLSGSVESVFRDFADNHTDYRNFRRPDVSEWYIVDENLNERFYAWKETAQGLKSGFDKFYGSGIVD